MLAGVVPPPLLLSFGPEAVLQLQRKAVAQTVTTIQNFDFIVNVKNKKKRKRSKLTQKPIIILCKEPDVINAILHHRSTVNAHSECVAGIFFRIDIAISQNIRMHHASAKHFEPAGMLAYTTAFSPENI